MSGMTLKQFALTRFYSLLEQYREAARDHTLSGRQRFVALSVQVHAAKGAVPKRYWPLVGRAYREIHP